MKQLIVKTALMIVSGMFLISCADVEKPDMDNTTTSDNANSQSLFDDAMKISEEALDQGGTYKLGQLVGSLDCVTIDSVHLSPTHKRFTLTFNGNCTDYDGKKRSGQLVVDVTGGKYNEVGTVVVVKSKGYEVQDIQLNGMKTITCLTNSPDTTHRVVVSDTTTGTDYATITFPNGEVAKWKSNRTRTLVAGNNTLTLADNIYDISTTTGVGNPAAEGINTEGRHYIVNIISPVRVNFSCMANNTARYPTQGVLELIPDGKSARSIDYGDGSCDNKITATVGGKSYDLTLGY